MKSLAFSDEPLNLDFMLSIDRFLLLICIVLRASNIAKN